MRSDGSKPRGVILVYHRVRASSQDYFHLDVEPALFRAQLEIVRRSYQPVPLDQISEPGSAQPRVAVTFDDGYANNLLVASTILVELGIPATFFINSAALDSTEERFWDQLERFFFEDTARVDRVEAFRHAHDQAMHAEPAGRAAIVRATIAAPRAPRPELRSLTTPELVELASRPRHEIGAHGENHLYLPGLSAELRMREVVSDKQRLESVLDRSIRSFSYPFGAMDQPSRDTVRDAGFRFAVSCEARAVVENEDAWALPRLEAAPLGASAFERALASLLER